MFLFMEPLLFETQSLPQSEREADPVPGGGCLDTPSETRISTAFTRRESKVYFGRDNTSEKILMIASKTKTLREQRTQ